MKIEAIPISREITDEPITSKEIILKRAIYPEDETSNIKNNKNVERDEELKNPQDSSTKLADDGDNDDDAEPEKQDFPEKSTDSDYPATVNVVIESTSKSSSDSPGASPADGEELAIEIDDAIEAEEFPENPDGVSVGIDGTPIPDAWRLKIPGKAEPTTREALEKLLDELTEELEEMPEAERPGWVRAKVAGVLGDKLPASLVELTAAHCFEGDSGVGEGERPPWLDVDKFRAGQRFARDYLFGITYADLISLFTVFSFEPGLKPLIITGASSTPYTAFKRYLSTGTRVLNWYTTDPWTPGTSAHKDINCVRRMHARVRRTLNELSPDEHEERSGLAEAWCPALEMTRRDFVSTCPAPAPGQCPYRLVDKSSYARLKKLSQGEMVATQFAFVGLVVLHPKFFGIHAPESELEAFCHVWRGIGYLLGIEDEFNFCRGTLEDVRTRSRDFLNYWVKPNFRTITPEWEHMMRCVVEGIQYYFPGAAYETCLLDLASIMNLHMPRLYNSLSYSLWIRHGLARFYFNHGSKLTRLRKSFNQRLERAIERANKYNEDKHKQLQDRSAKTLNNYMSEAQKNKSVVKKEKSTWSLRFLTQIILYR